MNPVSLLETVILLVYLPEVVLFSIWLPSYFRWGIPVFRRSYPLNNLASLATCLPALEKRFQNNKAALLEFRLLGSSECALRESFAARLPGLRFPLVMRGLLSLDTATGVLTITGRLSWYVIGMTAIFSYWFVLGLSKFLSTGGDAFQAMLVTALVFVDLLFFYLAQAYLYSQVARIAHTIMTYTTNTEDSNSHG